MSSATLIYLVLSAALGWLARHKGVFATDKSAPAPKGSAAEVPAAATLAELAAAHKAAKDDIAKAEALIKSVLQ